MILLPGIPTEPPLARVAYQLERPNIPVVVFNQREAAGGHVDFRLDPGGLRGELKLGHLTHRLEDVAAAYTRLMDDRILPELEGEDPDSAARTASRELHDALYRWLEITSARVVNRASAMGSNGSKPYQAQLIAQAGFAVPETLVTNDPELMRAFLAEHGRAIYKSVSGSRSIVQELTARDLARLEDIRWCPVQFQAYVEGVDVRVHVIGQQLFATRVTSGETDHRDAGIDGGEPARLEATELDDATAQRCIELAHRLGLRSPGLTCGCRTRARWCASRPIRARPTPTTRAIRASRSPRRSPATSRARRPAPRRHHADGARLTAPHEPEMSLVPQPPAIEGGTSR